jgi:hypothetical protein
VCWNKLGLLLCFDATRRKGVVLFIGSRSSGMHAGHEKPRRNNFDDP